MVDSTVDGGLAGAAAGAELGALTVAERDYGLSEDQLRELADSIPKGSAAAIMVIEHHWAVGLRDAVARAGGFRIAEGFISPVDLVRVGLLAAATGNTFLLTIAEGSAPFGPFDVADPSSRLWGGQRPPRRT